MQPDTIIPDQSNQQSWNRFSYTLNNPLRFNDPSGHRSCDEQDENGNCITYSGNFVGSAHGNSKTPIKDPNWKDKQPEERAPKVWNAICQSGGWWGSGCPNEKELSTWLLYEEGSTLNYSDQVNMARGMRYRFAYFGNTPQSFIFQLSGFTAFYNPDGDGDFDQTDWDELTNPRVDLSGYKQVVDAVYSSKLETNDGRYMYWWDEREVVTDKSQWPGVIGFDYIQTREVTGQIFYFTGIPNVQSCAMRAVNCK